MKKTLESFCEWLEASAYTIQPWSNEKTLQNQIGVFLNFWLPRTRLIELEVNVTKLPGITGGLRKKEADIIVSDGKAKSAIEVKFWRDTGTYNIGMFRCYEDIRFLEDLRSQGFGPSALIFFTEMPQHYQKSKRIPKPKNPENLSLHKTFRFDQIRSGSVQIKTGQLNERVSIRGTYTLNWQQLQGDVWYAIVEV
jgi:hypothetical protein